MRMKLQNELLIINILAIPLIITATFFPSSALHIVLGSPFVLFFPGYTLVVALFPGKDALDNIERVALSFGLSIAVVPLISLILNYTPWGIRLYPVLFSLVIFIVGTSLIAWRRRRALAEADRFTVPFNWNFPSWRGQKLRDRILSIVLIAAIGGAIGTVSYAVATPRVGEKFTEFYVLGSEGGVIDYPAELRVGEEGRVIVGIINREYEMVNYRVEVRVDGARDNQMGPLELGHDGKWEESVSFTPDRAGNNQKVEFLLYKDGENEPYLKLHLWVDVKE